MDLYNGDLQKTNVFFTHNFTQGWLNSYYSSSALSCLFIVLSAQSGLHSKSRVFLYWIVFSLSIPISLLFVYCIHIVCLLRSLLIYFLFSHWYCCCVRYLSIIFSKKLSVQKFSNFLLLHWCCCWFTYNTFSVCLSEAFVYRF